MSFLSSRRALLVAASLVVASCGGGTVESQLVPANVYGFGDGFSDVGQAGNRYTINDGSVNIWAQQVAASYNRPLTAASAGGGSYAAGNARVVAKPDAAGNSTTLTVSEQIDRFLATRSFGALDLVLVGAGLSDVIAQVQSAPAQAVANSGQAGKALAGQVNRLVASGARYVAVVGPYNLGRSAWAVSNPGQAALMEQASQKFNEELKVALYELDIARNVLYVDAPLFFNLAAAGSGGFSNAVAPACNSVDTGAGIGIGAGRVNSSRCTPATLAAGVDPNVYLFADEVYPTPQGHRQFGNYAYERIRNRW